MPISKPFRVVTEGQTTDGREVTRQQIQEMAEGYSRDKYSARVNLEHYLSMMPNSQFKAYGDVLSLKAEEIKEGPLAGKMGLYATVDVSDDLVKLQKDKQKLYSSIELHPNFANERKAYMMGLAFTDTPASLGTEVMKFSANNPTSNPFASRKTNPETLFTAAEETQFELELSQAEQPKNTDSPSLFSKIKQMFSAKKQSDDERFSDVHQAVELVAETQTDIQEKFSQLTAELQSTKSELAKAQENFNKLKSDLEQQEQPQTQQFSRPRATGDAITEQTDC